MALITTLSGTWTWNGTATVTSSNTTGVAVNDWIRMGAGNPSFKVTAVVADISVTIDLGGETAPSGSGAERDSGPIRDAILSAGDVVVTPTTEAITEPSGSGKTRKISEAYSSATVYAGRMYTVTYRYVSGPESPAWGALSGTHEAVS